MSGKAVHYCAARFFTSPVDITELARATPNTEFPPAVGTICDFTSIPCTGLDTDAVKLHMAELAVEFFTAKLARAAGGGVSGTVPATLSLTLGTAPSFGAFTPGVNGTYTATGTATVISSAGDATLSVADPSATATGRLVNGTFSLASPLLVGGNPLPTPSRRGPGRPPTRRCRSRSRRASAPMRRCAPGPTARR